MMNNNNNNLDLIKDTTMHNDGLITSNNDNDIECPPTTTTLPSPTSDNHATIDHPAEEAVAVSSKKTNNGKFFSYMMLPLVFFSWLSGTTHLVVYLYEKGWTRNPVEVALGLHDMPVEHNTAK